jgi:Ca2+-dependent lipid-binding protein
MSSPLCILLRVTVISASNLPRSDISSDSDPYVRLWLKGGTGFVPKENKTAVIRDNNNPEWGEILYFLLSEEEDVLCLDVMDYDDFSKDDVIGHAELYMADYQQGQNIILPLEGPSCTQETTLTLQFQTVMCLEPNQETKNQAGEVVKPDAVRFYKLMKINRRREWAIAKVGLRDPLSLVYIMVHSAADLYMDEREIQDYISYAVITFNEHAPPRDSANVDREQKVMPRKRQTKTSALGVNPRWKQWWYFLARSCDSLTVTIKKWNPKKQEEIIGTVDVELDDIGTIVRKVKPQGSIKLTVRVAPCRGLI